MTQIWEAATVQVLNPTTDEIVYESGDIVRANGSWAWGEIGDDHEVVVPWTGTGLFGAFPYDFRCRVTVINQVALTTHIVADFLIESRKINEMKASNGGIVPIFVVSGRDILHELGYRKVKQLAICERHQSYDNVEVMYVDSFIMSVADTARWAENELIDMTVALDDEDNWSRVVSNRLFSQTGPNNGRVGIDPVWQIAIDEGYASLPDEEQGFTFYTADPTLTSGSDTDLKQIMSYAPAWSFAFGSKLSTDDGSYNTPNGESVLRMLQLTAAQTGEYWWRIPGSRTLFWSTTKPYVTHPQYGEPVTLTTPTNAQAYYSDWSHGTILPGARYVQETQERVTRVRPQGGGQGGMALTLKHLPNGFVVDDPRFELDGEYLVYTAGELTGIEIDRDLSLPEVEPINGSQQAREKAAEALYLYAKRWLSQRLAHSTYLNCDVHCHVPLYPVRQIAVFYLGVMTTMNILKVDVTFDDGTVIYGLQLSTGEKPLMTDERFLAEALRRAEIPMSHVNSPARNDRTLDTLRAAVVPEGGGLTTDHGLLSGLGDDDHFQYWNDARGEAAIGEHAAIEDAHHDPATAANGTVVVSPGTQEIGVQYTGTGALAASSSGLYVKLAPSSGLQRDEDGLYLMTPGTVGANTANTTGPNHTHEVTGVTDAKATPDELIKGDGNGDVTLRWLTADKIASPLDLLIEPAGGDALLSGNLEFQGSRVIRSSVGSPLTLNPDQALNLQSVNSTIRVFDQLATDHWVSGLNGTGWGVSYDGEADFRYLETEELHAYAFIADAMRVRVNGLVVAPSAAVLAADFVVPSVSSSATITVEDAPGFNAMPVFADEDYVLLRVVDRSGGGLDISNSWGQVYAYVDNENGTQSWTFTTRSSRAAGRTAYAGLEVVDYGQSGSGRWMATATEAFGPYSDIATWKGNPYTGSNWEHWFRAGNLDGLSGYALQFGAAMGRIPNGRRFVGSNATLEAHGLALTLYETTPDDGQLRVTAVELNCDYFTTSAGTASVTERPDSQVFVENVEDAGGNSTNLHTDVDDDPDSPNTADYIYAVGSASGQITLGLSNFPSDFARMRGITVKADIRRFGFVNDKCELYAVVMDSSGQPLTDIGLLATESGVDGLHTVHLRVLPQESGVPPSLAIWNGARLRLRWVYGVTEGTATLRLDPDVPSFALGNALPTGMSSGGDGIWMGLDSGAYKMRIGRASGHGLRWDGQSFYLRDSSGDDVIVLDSGGDSYFAGVMTIGEDGSIQQGTGTIGINFNGIRVYQSGNVGKFGVYGASNLVINNTAGSEVGYLGGLADGGGLGNAQEIYLNASGSGARAVSAIAEGGGGSVAGTVSRSAINSSVHQIYAGGNVIASFDGYNDEIELNELTRISESLVVGNSTDSPASGRIQATQGIATDTGLIAGDRAGTGYMGAVTMYQRTDAPSAVSGAGVLYVFESGGAQSLRIRFANGTVKTIATDV